MGAVVAVCSMWAGGGSGMVVLDFSRGAAASFRRVGVEGDSAAGGGM